MGEGEGERNREEKRENCRGRDKREGRKRQRITKKSLHHGEKKKRQRGPNQI